MIVLRDYQEEAVDATFDYIKKGGRAGVVEMPMGSGKTAVISSILQTMCTKWHSTHSLIITHKYELIEQNEAMFKALCPEIKTGIFSAGLKRKNTRERAIFAGIQSIYNKVFSLKFRVDLLIVDEAQFISLEEGTQYQKLIHDLLIANPNIVILGFSASPWRMYGGYIYGPEEDKLFNDLIYKVPMRKLLDDGWLCPVVSKGTIESIDTNGIKKTGGEYNMRALENAADKEYLIKSTVDEIISNGKDRKTWLIFCTGKKHAMHVRDEIKSRGISCEMVTADTPKTERDQIIDDFRNQKIRCLVNIMILGIGTDVPCIDLIALLFATCSSNRFYQCVGRGMRLCNGKTNCLILDHGGNFNKFGYIDEINPNIKEKSSGDGNAILKECPECHTHVYASARMCPCGYEFPQKDPHDINAYDGAVLSTQEEAHWYEVLEVAYNIWPGKNGKPHTLRCDFYTSNRQQPYSMWLALNHDGYPHKKGMQYVNACGGLAETVEHAYKESFNWIDPTAIQVQRDPKDKKYWQVVGFNFPDEKPTTQETLI